MKCALGVFSIFVVGLMGCSSSTSTPASGSAPTLGASKLQETAVGASSITLSWTAATSSSTDLIYRVYRSAANPSAGSFTTVAEVTAGTLITSGENLTTATISSGLTSGASYYFNVVVTDPAGNQTAYVPVGEYFDSSLELFYPFDGNANDVGPSGNNGMLSNSPTPSADRFGYAHSAFTFARASVQGIVSSGNLSVSGASARTLTFWVKATDSNYSANDVLVSNGANNPSEIFGSYINGGDSDFVLWLNGSDVNTTVAYTGAWQQLAIVYDGTNYIGYVNGALGTSSAVSLNTGGGTATPLYIASAFATSNYFSGSIDDVRYYHSALSSTAVGLLYAVTH